MNSQPTRDTAPSWLWVHCEEFSWNSCLGHTQPQNKKKENKRKQESEEKYNFLIIIIFFWKRGLFKWGTDGVYEQREV